MTPPNIHFSFQSLWRSLMPVYGNSEGEAKAVTRLLLEDMYGMTMADICGGALEQMNIDDKRRLDAMMMRLLQGEPVQYIIGESVFCGRRFIVEPCVLIPRPETAQLCRMVVTDHDRPVCALQPPLPLRVLDIGTGSGCIAVTLALSLFRPEVTAWDISAEALLVARANAKRYGAHIDFQLQDALCAPHDEEKWDVIVSNPPYISNSERKDMSPHVLDHEPHTALFVPDDDPLRFYRAIATYAASALKKDGTLYFEINPRFAEQMREMLQHMGFVYVEIVNDEYGKRRFCKSQFAKA